MRILAIGLGGAGCRIVGSLYTTDRRSSRVACVQSLAIDVDGDTLAKLGNLPENAKLYFPALEAVSPDNAGNTNQTATVDIGEVIARIQNVEIGETDAIFICCGLGGSMADVAPHIATALRASIIEPIFGLFTLPCLSEGEKRSAKAADDIERLSPLLDGIILFDNETWSKKIHAQKTALVKKDTGGAGIFGFGRSKPDISPADATRILLNEGIVRRISLILRAGEFKADGGIELAEVVMDSGEVLNTMKGMGFITIGYAVEHLPQHPFGFLSRWRPVNFFAGEHKKSASRIVELAKKAIYNEISTPCDMTSAAKALILVAGPSHELSLKGFMTVRKWIDRSIAGLETRSGDYPVTNTKYVAIIIMLSGLENIPRLTELNEIRAQYTSGLRGDAQKPESHISGISSGLPDAIPGETNKGIFRARNLSEKKDEMLVLPGKKSDAGMLRRDRAHEIPRQTDSRDPGIVQPVPDDVKIARDDPSHKIHLPGADTPKKTISVLDSKVPSKEESGYVAAVQEPAKVQPRPAITHLPRRHLVVSKGEKGSLEASPKKEPASHHEPLASPTIPQEPPAGKGHVSPELHAADRDPSPRAKEDILKRKDHERHRIEHELQRQRMMAISGRTQKKEPFKTAPHNYTPDTYRRKDPGWLGAPPEPGQDLSSSSETVQSPVPEKRTLIVAKKKNIPKEDFAAPVTDIVPASALMKDVETASSPPGYPDEREQDEVKIGLKDATTRANDEVLAGKGISKRESPRVNDEVLLHTEFKPGKNQPDAPKATHDPSIMDRELRTSRLIRKRTKKTADDDEISPR